MASDEATLLGYRHFQMPLVADYCAGCLPAFIRARWGFAVFTLTRRAGYRAAYRRATRFFAAIGQRASALRHFMLRYLRVG